MISELKNGFTLVEIFVVIGLLIVIASLSATLGRQALIGQELRRTQEIIRSELVRAQGDTIAGTRDGSWGVAVNGDTITRFQGTSYATRNPAFDVTTTFGGTTIAGPAEIVFTRPRGIPVAGGTITIMLESRSATVVVNASGAIEAQ